MITKWKVFNFKSIREETELSLGPLTIFAGANSSGKSTLIQSILLVAQTLAHKVGSRSVVLNGSLASLGQFDDLKSNDSLSDQILINFTCCPLPVVDNQISQQPVWGSDYYFGSGTKRLREVSCEIAFDADPSNSQRDLYQMQPRLFASQLNCTFRDKDNLDHKAEITIRKSKKAISEIENISNSDIGDQIREGLAYEVEIDNTSLTEVREEFRSVSPVGCILKHFLPERVVYSINTIQEDAWSITMILQGEGFMPTLIRKNRREILLTESVLQVMRNVLEQSSEFNDLFIYNDNQKTLIDEIPIQFLNERLRSLTRISRLKFQQLFRETEDLFEKIYSALKESYESLNANKLIDLNPPREIIDAALYLDNFFTSSLKYLGPLRDDPKPLYPLASTANPYDVGRRGEHTAAIIELHKNKMINYIPSSYFTSSTIERKIVTRTLETAVIDWLQYLGVAKTVNSRDQGKLGHELKVTLDDSENTHDLTHVGVGVSQVIPILVICLLAEPDFTLVFEQPELHLHPKVQTLLGDFFLSMALCNKQCIVETHSEYLIDRLRFRIAAASLEEELQNKTKIYFVEKTSQNSTFREVVVNEYGAITDWPEGFFDQSQQQAEDIIRAATVKRKANRRNNNE